MAIVYNPALLDRYLAPGISVFTTCDAPNIEELHPEAPHWLANHFLNSIVRGAYNNRFRQYAMNQIFRAQIAFSDYHEARNLTAQYLALGRPNNPASRAYFQALSRWESCLMNLQIFIDVMNKMKRELQDDPVFTENDGTREQRAYSMANTVKHFGSDVAAGRHVEEDTVPMWLTNLGLKTRLYEISFQDLATLVSEIATAAGELQDPLSFVNPNR